MKRSCLDRAPEPGFSLCLLLAAGCVACSGSRAGGPASPGSGGAPSLPGASSAASGGKASPQSSGSSGVAGLVLDAGRPRDAGRASASDAGAAAGTGGRASLSPDSGVGGRGAAGGGGAGGHAGASAQDGGSDDRCAAAVLDPSHSPQGLTLAGDLGTHDPSALKAGSRYYLFFTGPGIQAKTSDDLLTWRAAPAVFKSNPAWIAQQVPGATDLWAPDISFFGGQYQLYYAASTFGSNHSCIGHATRASMDSGAFADQGSVICSNANGSNDDWNALDPNVVLDEDGTPWLAFGSFWSGLKIVKLDQSGKRADTELHAIAARPNNGGALEAAYIVKRCGYYYLFTSFDKCCQGANSTYKIMVGRSAVVTGPYMDKAGMAMMQGGGTLILQGGTRWRGPGHNAVLFDGDKAYNIYHSYDANNNGNSYLRISELAWDGDGWPVSGGP